MASSPDPFARRNRARIALMLMLATVNYMVAIALATVAVVLTIILGLFLEGGDIPGDLDALKFFGIAIGGIAVVSAVAGAVIRLVRIPFQRRRLERYVLKETGAHIAGPAEHPRARNLLEGLALAASESSGDDDFLKGVLGYLPKRFREWLHRLARLPRGDEQAAVPSDA